MARKVSEGVGKKIVEALKKQSEIEVNPASGNVEDNDFGILDELSESGNPNINSANFGDDFGEDFSDNSVIGQGPQQDSDFEDSTLAAMGQSFMGHSSKAASSSIQENFISELDTFEIPSNIAVLKKLIGQLPSGVSKHTGAQIIKQTMEALGISMKSVLQEAQQVQEGLNTSAKECFSTIQEYKKQIVVLDKQAQNYQRQYAALNELISLFIQTGM